MKGKAHALFSTQYCNARNYGKDVGGYDYMLDISYAPTLKAKAERNQGLMDATLDQCQAILKYRIRNEIATRFADEQRCSKSCPQLGEKVCSNRTQGTEGTLITHVTTIGSSAKLDRRVVNVNCAQTYEGRPIAD